MALIFFDTEFIDDGKTIDLISIGMVRGDGKTYYAEFVDAPWPRIFEDEWILDNVYRNLTLDDLKTKKEIADEILEFVGPHPEFWAWYGAYDWVVLSQLYGKMIDVPTGWPHFCRDLRQLAHKTKLPKQTTEEHHALNDALWVKDSYYWIKQQHIKEKENNEFID